MIKMTPTETRILEALLRNEFLAFIQKAFTTLCSATIWMRKQRQSGWPFWRSRRGDDCRGATITQALFCREMI